MLAYTVDPSQASSTCSQACWKDPMTPHGLPIRPRRHLRVKEKPAGMRGNREALGMSLHILESQTLTKSRTHTSSRPMSPCCPVMPELWCHTCDAQPAQHGPDTAPPITARSCFIHCAWTATHSLPFGALHSTRLPPACPHVLCTSPAHTHVPPWL